MFLVMNSVYSQVSGLSLPIFLKGVSGSITSDLTSNSFAFLLTVNVILLVFVILLLLRLVYKNRKELERTRIKGKRNLSSDLYQAVLDHSHDVVFILKGNKLDFFNKRLEDLSGYSFDELKEMTVTDLLVEKLRDSFKKIIESGNIEETGNKSLKLRIITKAGEKVYLDVDMRKVCFQGECIFLGFAEDVTQVVLKDKELKKYLSELEHANGTKDKFLSIIAHDLKNPINVIMGLSELTYSSYEYFDEAEVKDNLKTIYEATGNAYQLLENLLKWSRAQKGMLSFNPVSCLVDHMIDELLAPLKPHAETKDISMKVDLENGLQLYCDRDMIMTVLRNILSNAIKFSEHGSQIDLIVKKVGAFIQFAVKDQGVGMTSEDCENLFNLKHQIRNKGTSKEDGTGLGLLLTKEFIDIHGGKIEVKSQLNAGTSFIISLPAK